MFPCKKEKEQIAGTGHYQIASFSGILGGKRRLLSGGSGIDHCTDKVLENWYGHSFQFSFKIIEISK